MVTRRARAGAVMLGLTLALTASPATAMPEQERTATPTAETAQPPQQQATGSAAASNVATDTAESLLPSPSPTADQQPQARVRLLASPRAVRVSRDSRFIRPGEEFVVGYGVSGTSYEDFVLTVTAPPEVTVIGGQATDLGGADCSGNVCRANTLYNVDGNWRSFEFRFRLSESFRGTMTTVRGDLAEDDNPEYPEERTATTIVDVEQPASSGSAPGTPGTPGRGGAANAATASGTLPRTGERTTVTAALALALLLVGGMAQAAGSRRARPHED